MVLVHNYSQVSLDVLRSVLSRGLYRDLLWIAVGLYDYVVGNGVDA
ncbi:hypothetical protein [Vulcanisaeta sp. JCM 14467]|nr:hypothetical protein [Vulcanisaeta sp. JCM 14467]